MSWAKGNKLRETHGMTGTRTHQAWIEQQQNNRRSNKLLTIGIETHTYAEWERINGLPRGIVKQRIAAGVKPAIAVAAKSNRGMKLCG